MSGISPAPWVIVGAVFPPGRMPVPIGSGHADAVVAELYGKPGRSEDQREITME